MNPKYKRVYCDGAEVQFRATPSSTGKKATVTDYNPSNDKYFVQYTSDFGGVVGMWVESSTLQPISIYFVTIDPKEVVSVPKATAVKAAKFRNGDRVRFRYNGRVGTVQTPGPVKTLVIYDNGNCEVEKNEHLDLIHSPETHAETKDTPHPAQAALDAIDEQRRVIKLRVDADQRKLSELKRARKFVEMGV